MDREGMEIAVQYQMKGLSRYLERSEERKPPGSRRSDGRIHWAPGVQTAKTSWCPSNSTACPCSSHSRSMHSVLRQSRKKYSCLCQWLTWSQSTLAASHQGRMGVPPSQLLKWVLLFSANFPQLVVPGWTLPGQSLKTAPRFPNEIWLDRFSSADSNQVRCPQRHPLCRSQGTWLLLVFTLCGCEKATRQTDPSMWHCH